MTNEYIAGLFDGDGCVRILYRDSVISNRCYYIDIQITNNYLPVLETIQGIWKGNIFTHNDTFQWRLTSKKAYAFLKAIYPYIVIKKKQTAIALEFQKRLLRSKRSRLMHKKGIKGALGFRSISNKEMEWRDKAYLEISRLKNPETFELKKLSRKSRLIRRNAEMQTPS